MKKGTMIEYSSAGFQDDGLPTRLNGDRTSEKLKFDQFISAGDNDVKVIAIDQNNIIRVVKADYCCKVLDNKKSEKPILG